MSDDIREWVSELTCAADAAKAAGKDVTMQISPRTAYVLASCVVRYFAEERPACPLCDHFRDDAVQALNEQVGSLRYLIADLSTVIDDKPALVEKVRRHVIPNRKPGPIISRELRDQMRRKR